MELDFSSSSFDVNYFREEKEAKAQVREFKNLRPGWFEFQVTKVKKDNEKHRLQLTCAPIDADGETARASATLFMSLPHPAVCPKEKARITLDSWYKYLTVTRPDAVTARPIWDKEARLSVDADGNPLDKADAEELRAKSGQSVFSLVGDLWGDPESLIGDRFFAPVEHTVKEGKTYANIKSFSMSATEPATEAIIRENFTE